MIQPLPKWIMHRYAILYRSFKQNPFNHDQAAKALKKDRMLSIALSQLRQNGWLGVQLDQNDARKRIYTLKNPEQAVAEMGVQE